MTKPSAPQIVGVIFTGSDLRRAVRMRSPPDLFELRLDALFARSDEVRAAIEDLRAPLIITARHPREGGLNQLSAQQRRDLLLRFLPHAAYVDIELRATAAFSAILEAARATGIGSILSFHDFKKTPSGPRLDEIARAARSLGADFLKIATRTDTPEQLTTLRDFLQRERLEMKVAAMGVGRAGRVSRFEFARLRSALNYGHLGNPQAEGQLSITQLRRILRQNVPPEVSARIFRWRKNLPDEA
jgi:3-dehydroquinate dehydratase I